MGIRGWIAGVALGLATATAAQAAEPTPRTLLGKTVYVESQDEFAEIQTGPTKQMLGLLRSPDEADRAAGLKQAMANPNRYAPPVLFEISRALYARNEAEEATYWYLLARVRSVNDSYILVDETAKTGLLELVQAYSPGFAAYVPQHMDVVWAQLNRAVEWDRANPPAYDRRWMALHGMRAIQSGLDAQAGRKREREQITVPQDEWAALDEENRRDMLSKMKKHMDQ